MFQILLKIDLGGNCLKEINVATQPYLWGRLLLRV